MAGLRLTGIIAPFVLDGPMNGDAFRAYVEQVLAPDARPGDVVVLDNLAATRVDGVAEAIEAAGAALLYLPPYCPDLNPIERLRQAQGAPAQGRQRTVEGLWAAIGRLVDLFPPTSAPTTSATAAMVPPKAKLL